MPLTRYASECRALAEEAAQMPSEAEIATLREQLRALGLSGWLAWRQAHAERVASFVSAAPAARKTRRQWQNDRLLLVLAAYQYCQGAADLLSAAERLRPGCSYRQMAAEAGLAHDRLQSQDWLDWPWDDPDPFDDPV